MNTKMTNNISERVRIQEKALSNLADRSRKHDLTVEEELADLRKEVKALTLFLARYHPEFKERFPEIQRKVK